MSKTQKKLTPFSAGDFEYTQTWLEEKSREGLHLKKLDRYIATFESGEPCERRYRVFPELAIVDKGDIRYYQNKGWHYIDSSPFPVFYTDDPEVDEIYKNLSKYNGVRQEVMFSGILQIVICISLIAWIIFLQIQPEYLDVPLHLIASLDYWKTILFSFMSACFVIMIILSIVRIVRFDFRVKRGDKIRHNLKTKGKHAVRVVSVALGMMMVVYIFYALLSDSSEVLSISTQSLQDMRAQAKNTVKHHPLAYENLNPEEWDEFLVFLNKTKKVGSPGEKDYCEYFYKRSSNIVCSECGLQEMYSTYTGYYSASYYKLRDKDEVDTFKNETLKIFAWSTEKVKIKQVKGYDIDEVSKGVEEEGTQVLVLKDGKKLEFIRSDKCDLFNNIDKYVDDIKRK